MLTPTNHNGRVYRGEIYVGGVDGENNNLGNQVILKYWKFVTFNIHLIY